MDAAPTRYAGRGCNHHGGRLGRVLLRPWRADAIPDGGSNRRALRSLEAYVLDVLMTMLPRSFRRAQWCRLEHRLDLRPPLAERAQGHLRAVISLQVEPQLLTFPRRPLSRNRRQ
jgi:hypothetical protein